MADRQDIDALLIGALYGELDDEERARLEAHLASHPQDRSALDGLRSTRELLREADLPGTLAVAEPSPAITAMLLQEAARRAPTPARGGGVLAFLAGLLKPFAASPALSAAAALVLVGGAAGLLYSRGSFRTSEPSVSTAGESRQVATADQLEERAPAPEAPAGAAAPGTGDLAADEASERTVDDYRVGLVDGERTATGATGVDRGLAKEAQEGERKNTELAGVVGADGAAGKGRRGGSGSTASSTAFQTARPDSQPDTMTAKLDDATRGSARPGYLTIDGESKDAPTVLSLDGKPSDGAEAEAARREVADKSAKKKAAPPPPPPPATAGAATTQKPVAGAGGGAVAPQQVARDQGKAGSKAYDATKAAALDAWARDQHARMVKLVNAGKCTDAGTIGADIARKHPDYYQANVANDRAVRACRSYVDRARRAKAEDAKTKAAAPRNNAPDSPYEADMESAK